MNGTPSWYLPSSPPARGSSLRQTRGDGGEQVVPARAGIFPHLHRLCPGRGGRPRPRGDLPRPWPLTKTRRSSSPPARGSSRRSWPAGCSSGVVPARAGIFPAPRVSCSPGWSRPRPRGDLPAHGPPGPAPGESSPPARGSSWPAAAPASRPSVVPARAGIFPATTNAPETLRSRPRPRGDLPLMRGPRRRKAKSSPPARGSSPVHGARVQGDGVVPARAGIFRYASQGWTSVESRPRPRGDLPAVALTRAVPAGSSPPARGSSRGVTGRELPEVVVPARAGIFPPTACHPA